MLSLLALWALLPVLSSSSSCSVEELAMIGCDDSAPPWCAPEGPEAVAGDGQHRVALLIVGALLGVGASTRGGTSSSRQAAVAHLPASAAVGGGSASPLLPAGGTAALSGGGPAGEAAPDEAAERAALVHFLQHERAVDELVEALAL